jgi:hypothetical protein
MKLWTKGFGFSSRSKSRGHVLTLALTLSLSLASLHSPTLHADELDDQLNDICGKTLNAPPTPTTDPNVATMNAQKLNYCQAAQGASSAAGADSAMWKVWAGVGTVCTYACVASFTGLPTSEYICMGVTLAGGLADAFATKNFVSALTAIGGVGAGYIANQTINKASDSAGPNAPPKAQKDIGACLNAGIAAVQVYAKHSAMKNDEDSVRANLDSAKKLTDSAAAAVNGTFNAQNQAATATGTGNANGGGTTTHLASDISGNSNFNASSACAQARNTSNPAVIMSCAVASDRNLPGFVSSPKFAKEIQKDSGTSLADFLGKGGTPTSLMGQAMSNGMSPNQAGKLAAALSQLENNVGNYEGSGPAYAGGGGGAARPGEGDESMTQMMSTLMDQLHPGGKPGEEKKVGVSAVAFANQTRSPASVVNDKTLNIFDRVTYRYYYVGRRLVLGEAGPK